MPKLKPYLLLLLILSPAAAHADGTQVSLHASQGPYTITLFTAPEPLTAGPADLTLLIQSNTGDDQGPTLLNTRAEGTLTPETPSATAIPLHFGPNPTPGGSQLLAANPSIPIPGAYLLTLHLNHPGLAPATIQGTITILPNHSRQTTVWFFTLAPLLAILLFLLNQAGKHRLSSR